MSLVNLLGLSMGGFIALDCVIRYPEYILKLILAGTYVYNSRRNNTFSHDWVSYAESGMNPEQWFRNIFYWIFTKRFFDDTEVLNNAVRFAVEYPCPQSAIAFGNQVNAIQEFNCPDDLPGITARTMIVCGKEDLLFSPEESFRVLNAIPGALFTVVEHAAHSIHTERPGEFVNTVREFLRDC